jgi:hypothetical protein
MRKNIKTCELGDWLFIFYLKKDISGCVVGKVRLELILEKLILIELAHHRTQ